MNDPLPDQLSFLAEHIRLAVKKALPRPPATISVDLSHAEQLEEAVRRLTPTAQSGPSEAEQLTSAELHGEAERIAVNLRDRGHYLAATIMRELIRRNASPPAGARDAVTDRLYRVLKAIDERGITEATWDNAKRVMADYEAALAGKADGGQDAGSCTDLLACPRLVCGCKATKPAAPRTRHPLAHRERMCERVSTNPEPQPAAAETTNSTEISSKLVVGNTAAPGAGEGGSVADDVMFGWRLAASNVCEKDARRAAAGYARKKVAP